MFLRCCHCRYTRSVPIWAVPLLHLFIPAYYVQSPQHYCIAGDGSVFGRGLWQQMTVTYRALEYQEAGPMTVDQMLKEMDALA